MRARVRVKKTKKNEKKTKKRKKNEGAVRRGAADTTPHLACTVFTVQKVNLSEESVCKHRQ